MRILHTSDWHIGRTFHGHSTLAALRTVLDALVAQVTEHEVDVVVVAGDVFDSAVPAADCYTLLTDTLVALRDAGARVVATSGNHDSAARLGFQARLLRDGIHVLTDPASIGMPITIDDAHGPVDFYGIPYLEPALLRHEWAGVRTQADVLATAMARVRQDAAGRPGHRSIAIAHCFAAGVEATPSLERDIQQGGLDVVPLATFDGPDYVALGHIHGRARLSDRVRYAGAPLHYSFGEQHKQRGSWLVDLDEAGLAQVIWLELPVPRRLRTLHDTLEALLTDPAYGGEADSWVRAEYTDTLPQRDPMRRLQERFPNCAMVVHAPARVAADDARTYVARVREARTDLDLIDAFLMHVRAGAATTEAERSLLREVIDERVIAEASA